MVLWLYDLWDAKQLCWFPTRTSIIKGSNLDNQMNLEEWRGGLVYQKDKRVESENRGMKSQITNLGGFSTLQWEQK